MAAAPPNPVAKSPGGHYLLLAQTHHLQRTHQDIADRHQNRKEKGDLEGRKFCAGLGGGQPNLPRRIEGVFGNYKLREVEFKTVYSCTFSARESGSEHLLLAKVNRHGLLEHAERERDIHLLLLRLGKSPHIVHLGREFEYEDRCENSKLKEKLIVQIFEDEGRTLHGEFIKAGRFLSISSTISVAKQLLSAMEFLDKAGILHRRICPDTVLVSQRRKLVVKLTDFEFASFLKPDKTYVLKSTDRSQYTSYRSPEELLGKPLTQKTAVWSLGNTLFEVHEGSLPFPAGKQVGFQQDQDHFHTIVTQIGHPNKKDIKKGKYYGEGLELQPASEDYRTTKPWEERVFSIDRESPTANRSFVEFLAGMFQHQDKRMDIAEAQTLADKISLVAEPEEKAVASGSAAAK